MKRYLLFTLALFCLYSNAQTYPAMNISMLGSLDPCNAYAGVLHPATQTKYSSVWGWVDPQDNKEYAILGGADGYYFIDVTNPSNPVQVDFEAGHNPNALWREIKTYGNYCYVVSDDALPNGFIIADLSYLPDSIHVVHKSDTIIRQSHTIYVSDNKLYCGWVNVAGVGRRSMGVYDLTNPVAPQLLRTLYDDYPQYPTVHDMWVENDTVYASCGDEGFHIFKFNSNNTFTEIGSYTTYIDQGYNHSSYRTADKSKMVFCDEVPANLAVKIVDVTDPANLSLLDTFKSNNGATAHNPYIIGNNLCYISYYQDGLYLFDISNANTVSVLGYFDTHPQNGLNNGYPSWPSTYMGAWGAYPYLPSGIVLVSDMQKGLFVLDASQATGMLENKNGSNTAMNLYPNPSSDVLNVDLMNLKGAFTLSVYDVNGREIRTMDVKSSDIIHHDQIDISALSSGVYQVVVKNAQGSLSRRFVKE